MHNKYRVPFYYCKLHPHIENIYLQSIEHHCKFSQPEVHKSAVLEALEQIIVKGSWLSVYDSKYETFH
jgi:hypothetical protein